MRLIIYEAYMAYEMNEKFEKYWDDFSLVLYVVCFFGSEI